MHTLTRLGEYKQSSSLVRGVEGFDLLPRLNFLKGDLQKMQDKFEFEAMRHNVTPAQFLSYIRSRVDAKGGRYIRTDLDLRYFSRGDDFNFDIRHGIDDSRTDLAGIHEKSVSKPYEMQTYIRYPSGDLYNEICEFDFWDEKTGTGYYYLCNIITREQA